MPTYDYRCKQCGHEFAAFQSITQDPLSRCPECGEDSLRRLIGAGAGIIFKGSGFYETDYKRSRKPNGGGESKGSEKKSESKSETKADSSSKSDSGGKKSSE